MTIHRGTVWSQVFQLKNKTTGVPFDISSWTFKAEFQKNVSDDVALVSLTSANNGFSIVDGPNGRFRMVIDDSETSVLPIGRIVFDVWRTDQLDGPRFLFRGHLRVKESVNR